MYSTHLAYPEYTFLIITCLQLPVFVVGTKQDQIAEVRTSVRVRSSSIADECAADEISVVSNIYMVQCFVLHQIIF